MKKFFIAIIFVAICACAEPAAATLAELKIAADAGDPIAQDEIALRDPANAEMWYRKAAEQGCAHSEGQLGHRLLLRSGMAIGLKPAAQEAMQEDALKWIILAANQGDKQGQADLAQVYLNGKLVKQDFMEAYKWGELCSKRISFDLSADMQGCSARDAAILKMNADQIAEARKRVAAFIPHQLKKSDLPEPVWVQKIKLGGISGTPDHRFALINNKTFGKGDQSSVKIGGNHAVIHCLEIRELSVVISIDGIDGKRELKLP